MTAGVAAILPILVGRAVDVSFRLGFTFGAAVAAVAMCPAVLFQLPASLFTSESLSVVAASAALSTAVSSSSVVGSTRLVVVAAVVVAPLCLKIGDCCY